MDDNNEYSLEEAFDSGFTETPDLIASIISGIVLDTLVKNGVENWEGYRSSLEEGIKLAEEFFGLPEGAIQFTPKELDNNKNKNLN